MGRGEEQGGLIAGATNEIGFPWDHPREADFCKRRKDTWHRARAMPKSVIHRNKYFNRFVSDG
jgi:hypothetical protein